jgi:hypothetical protein
MTERTKTKVSLYYSRKTPGGRLTIVRNTRRPSMMDSLSTPYAQGIYTGAAGVGLITGMAMMGRRQGNERIIESLKKNASFDVGELDEFGYACGSTFIPKAQVKKVPSVPKLIASFSQPTNSLCRKVRIGTFNLTLRDR